MAHQIISTFLLWCFSAAAVLSFEPEDKFEIRDFSGAINVKTLSKAKNRTVLIVTKNAIESIENGALCAAPFHTIWMQYNQKLPKLTKNSFGHCPQLKDILIGKNDPKWTFENDAFSQLENLERLIISNQPAIKQVSKAVLVLPPSLVKFGLRSSDLSSVDLSTFDGLEKLEAIWLNSNQIKELKGSFGSTLSKLSFLDFSSDPLGVFPWEALRNLKSLHWLSLIDTDVKNYNVDKIAENAPNLIKLYMRTFTDDCDEMKKFERQLKEKYGRETFSIYHGGDCKI